LFAISEGSFLNFKIVEPLRDYVTKNSRKSFVILVSSRLCGSTGQNERILRDNIAVLFLYIRHPKTTAMRIYLLAGLTISLLSCNSSSKKTGSREAMDDTARMNDPAYTVSISATKLAIADIPVSIKIKGQLQEAWKWNDNLGENILITSYVLPYDDKRKDEFGEQGQTAELHAVHYAKKEGDYVQVWALNEEERSCPFDLTCNFVPGSATVTDLDKDGIAETKIQYIIACRSDVSPAVMKLALYENGMKYALTGSTWVPYSDTSTFTITEANADLEKLRRMKSETGEMPQAFGRYETEKDFASAPDPFLAYARKEWIKYVKEKMGE
jgi:hypothetical protein